MGEGPQGDSGGGAMTAYLLIGIVALALAMVVKLIDAAADIAFRRDEGKDW